MFLTSKIVILSISQQL